LVCESRILNYNFSEPANCEGIDTNMFFTEEDSKNYTYKESLIKICGNCKAKVECLEYAVSNYEILGWWGGTSEKQREEIRRARKAKKTPVR
jgi:WhiB family transcriptional regulator, redox-sensing transcriptional regulator